MGQSLRVVRATAALSPQAMAHEVMEFSPASDAEALKILRSRYPGAPLSLRVAALAFLMRHRPLSELARLPPE